jgi:predicted Zn-dependent protease
LWCLLPELLTRQAIKNYDHKSYHVARRWLTPLTWTSPQPFVIAFNSGTVDTQIGNYNIAQTELNKALKLAPPDKRCMVLQNLVYSLDAHAANLQHNSSSHAATPYSNQAASLTKSNPKCFQIAALTNHSKLQKKQSGGGGGSQSQQGLTSVQQQQLTQKNQLGQALSQQSLSQDSINPNSPAIKPW